MRKHKLRYALIVGMIVSVLLLCACNTTEVDNSSQQMPENTYATIKVYNNCDGPIEEMLDGYYVAPICKESNCEVHVPKEEVIARIKSRSATDTNVSDEDIEQKAKERCDSEIAHANDEREQIIINCYYYVDYDALYIRIEPYEAALGGVVHGIFDYSTGDLITSWLDE